jgi:hypothetical protein
MSTGRENGATNFSQPRQRSARAGQEINRAPGRFYPDRRSDLLQRLFAFVGVDTSKVSGFNLLDLRAVQNLAQRGQAP